jgi:tRNA C32,U32 (ribose-2'-O)-methylase TrmJ
MVTKKRGAKHAKAKKKAKKASKQGKADIDPTTHLERVDVPAATNQRAQLASKGRAVVQRARTAEREQRRLHGTLHYQTKFGVSIQ